MNEAEDIGNELLFAPVRSRFGGQKHDLIADEIVGCGERYETGATFEIDVRLHRPPPGAVQRKHRPAFLWPVQELYECAVGRAPRDGGNPSCFSFFISFIVVHRPIVKRAAVSGRGRATPNRAYSALYERLLRSDTFFS